jgi:hypothetical protein
MLDSVKRIDGSDAKIIRRVAEDAGQQKVDADVIESVRAAMTNGQSVKGDIEKFVQGTSSMSRNKVRAVLDKYEDRLWLWRKARITPRSIG